MQYARRQEGISLILSTILTMTYRHAIIHKLLCNKRVINLGCDSVIDFSMECFTAHVNIVISKAYISLVQISNLCGMNVCNTLRETLLR